MRRSCNLYYGGFQPYSGNGSIWVRAFIEHLAKWLTMPLIEWKSSVNRGIHCRKASTILNVVRELLMILCYLQWVNEEFTDACGWGRGEWRVYLLTRNFIASWRTAKTNVRFSDPMDSLPVLPKKLEYLVTNSFFGMVEASWA